MSRRPARCTEADLKRAVKAAAGKMAVDVLPDGTIRLTPIDHLTSDEDDDEKELGKFRARCESQS